MRLIRTDESKEIVEFQAAPYPPYVALSHTWGKVGDEVTFQEMTHCREEAVKKPGFAKIDQCCKRAREDQFKYVWIDTCCIDKTSSAELSEAINSMYSWYQGARICYAYLEDVPTASDVVSEFEEAPFDEKQQFQNSRWFTRGWTLQELIAPGIVEFYAADWTEIGTKISLLNVLVAITGIDNGALAGQPLQSYTVAARLSWAGSRRTTRPEDRAYCLLGIFGVNMPMIYGEGDRAFLRLQEEIMKGAEDYTISDFCAGCPSRTKNSGGR
ncbi:HET-domain-containing protein [Thozetella sp. PMI_491]|nr:HET-domain-containing protein [Thozetella sp. PMI_491]